MIQLLWACLEGAIGDIVFDAILFYLDVSDGF